MRYGRTVAIVILALLAGGILSQLPVAMGDDSDNPTSSLWNAIFDLQSKDEQLQAQIDELRAERDSLLVQNIEKPEHVSDIYASIEVETLEESRTLVHITVGNNGPDRAAGVKLSAFYLMSLFKINHIEGDLCLDKSRGIIECIVGTLEEDQESIITIDTTSKEFGKATAWTVDISTTTEDVDYSNNHIIYEFETGSGDHVEHLGLEQPTEEEVAEELQIVQEQDSDDSANSTETEELHESAGNQTLKEPQEMPTGNSNSEEEVEEDRSSNYTNTEMEGSGRTENQTSNNATEEAASDSNSNSDTTAENSDPGQSQETSAEEPDQLAQQNHEESAGEETIEESNEESGGESTDEQESLPEEDTSEGKQEGSNENSPSSRESETESS